MVWTLGRTEADDDKILVREIDRRAQELWADLIDDEDECEDWQTFKPNA